MPGNTVHYIYDVFPPHDPGQNPGEKSDQKPTQKFGQNSGRKCVRQLIENCSKNKLKTSKEPPWSSSEQPEIANRPVTKKHNIPNKKRQ